MVRTCSPTMGSTTIRGSASASCRSSARRWEAWHFGHSECSFRVVAALDACAPPVGARSSRRITAVWGTRTALTPRGTAGARRAPGAERISQLSLFDLGVAEPSGDAASPWIARWPISPSRGRSKDPHGSPGTSSFTWPPWSPARRRSREGLPRERVVRARRVPHRERAVIKGKISRAVQDQGPADREGPRPQPEQGQPQPPERR